MDLCESLCRRRTDLCRGADPAGEDKNDAGKSDGASRVYGEWCWEPSGFISPLPILPAPERQCPLAGFGNLLWKGVKEAVDENGFIGIFMGGFQGFRGGNLSGADFRISGVTDFPAENETLIFRARGFTVFCISGRQVVILRPNKEKESRR